MHLRQPMFFDPKDKEHRKYYFQFVKTSSWAKCPYSWVIDDESSSVPHMMHKKLVDYYTQKEFGKEKV
jgi:hypothetical protein